MQVGSDGKAPAGLKAGDSVKTGGGIYRITGVNADGSYQSQKVAAPAPYGYTDYDGLKRTSEDSTDYAANYKNYLNAGNLGAQDVLDRLKNEQAAEGHKSALDGYMDQYGGKAEEIRDYIDAQTRQNIANLDAQRDLVRQAGEQANAAALQNYYSTINPNGAGAEQLQQDAWTRAGLTGSYAGQQTLAGQQAALEFKNMDIQNQRALLELEIQRKFGWDQAAADLYIAQKQGQGYDLENIYKELQNSYARRMM